MPVWKIAMQIAATWLFEYGAKLCHQTGVQLWHDIVMISFELAVRGNLLDIVEQWLITTDRVILE